MQLSSLSSINDNVSKIIKIIQSEAEEIKPKDFALSSWHLACTNSTSAQQRLKIKCFGHCLLLSGIVPFILSTKESVFKHFP